MPDNVPDIEKWLCYLLNHKWQHSNEAIFNKDGTSFITTHIHTTGWILSLRLWGKHEVGAVYTSNPSKTREPSEHCKESRTTSAIAGRILGAVAQTSLNNQGGPQWVLLIKQTCFKSSILALNRMKHYKVIEYLRLEETLKITELQPLWLPPIRSSLSYFYQQWSEPKGGVGILAKRIIKKLWYLSKGCPQIAMQLIQQDEKFKAFDEMWH